MNQNQLIIALLLAGLLPSELPAQDSGANYPPPTPPLVAPVPQNAAWILSLSDEKSPSTNAQAQPSQPMDDLKADAKNQGVVEVRVTKTGKLKRDIFSYGNGSTEEAWFADGVLLTHDSNNQIMVFDYKFIDANEGLLGNPLRSFGFTGLGWLNLKYYDQVVIYSGRPCYHYVMRTAQLPGPYGNLAAQTPTSPMGAEAWIDLKSGLPVAYTAGDGKLYTYRFLDSPTSTLTLPPDYQASLALYEKEQDKKRRLEAWRPPS